VYFVIVLGGQHTQEQIMNVTAFVVKVWGGQNREELIQNIPVFVVRA